MDSQSPSTSQLELSLLEEVYFQWVREEAEAIDVIEAVGKYFTACAKEEASPADEVERVRENLRVMMLRQPTTGQRETYSDGFAMGLCEAIGQLDHMVSSAIRNGDDHQCQTPLEWKDQPR